MTEQSTLQATTINQITAGFYPAIALMAGLQLNIFSTLNDNALTSAQLAEALNVHQAKLEPLLYALVKAGLLMSFDDHFANTPEANHFLVKEKPSFLTSHGPLLADFWGAAFHSAETIRTGIPQARHSDQKTSEFIHNLDPRNRSVGKQLAAQHDFSRYNKLLDVAGGSGGLSLVLTELYDNLHATIIDLPQVVEIAQSNIWAENAAHRVQVLPIDLRYDSIPGKYDVAILHRITNVLAPTEAQKVIHKVANTISSGGEIFIICPILDNSRLTPSSAVDINLSLINLFDDGEAHPEHLYRLWLTDAGFDSVERVAPNSLVARRSKG